MHDIADRCKSQSSPTFDARKNILYATYNRGIIGVTSRDQVVLQILRSNRTNITDSVNIFGHNL